MTNIKEQSKINAFQVVYRENLDREAERKHPILHAMIMLIVFCISFIFPLFGLFFYLIWRNDRPKDAKWPGIAALIGVSINIFLEVSSMIARGVWV